MNKRNQRLFALIWIVAAVATVWIYWNWQVKSDYLGIVEEQTHRLSFLENGRLKDLLVDIGTTVEAGQVLARLDTSDLLEEQKQLEGMLETLSSIKEGDRQRYLLESSRLRMQLEKAAMDLSERMSEIRSRRSELAAIETEIARLQQAKEAGLGHNRDLSDMLIRRDALKSYIAEQEKLMQSLQARRSEADSLRKTVDTADSKAVADSLQSDRLSLIQEIKSRLALIETRIGWRTVLAPVDGELVSVFARPGDSLAALLPVVSVSESRPQFLDAYIPEQADRPVAKGERVEVYTKRGRDLSTTGTVVFIHPNYDAIPARLAFRNQIYWARKVRIRLSDTHRLIPGEAVHVRFVGLPESGGVQAAEKKPDEKYAAKVISQTPIAKPDIVKDMSRFEPSGLVWLSDIKRFLIVSDDTGRKKKGCKDAPWLFLMDEKGALDPDLVVLDGIDKIMDLEVATPVSADRLLILSSQNISKKGKRSEHRRMLLEVAHHGRSFKVVRKASLMDALLASHTPEQLAGLGLTEKESDGLPVLNIEAAAYRDGALTIGLKQPTGKDGAILWKLSDVSSFLDSGKLTTGQLSLLGRVDLSQGGQPAGFSDLAYDASGRLFALSTIPKAKTKDQLGGCHLIHTSADGSFKAEKLYTLPNKKPEGLAIVAPGRIAIVTDEDDETPLLITLDVSRP